MKQYTSRILKSIAATFLAFPLIYVVIAATCFDISLNGCLRILLSPFYYVVTFSAVVAGYGLWEMRRWSWYIFVLAQVLILYEDAIFASDFAESHHKVFVFIITALMQLILSLRVAREIRVPYFFPKIRWWENNPRYKLTVPVEIERNAGEKLTGDILDISMAGCFIKFRSEMPSDQKVTLNLKIFGYTLVLHGVVVWSALSTVTHPRGIGVKFDFLTKDQKRVFRSITSRLRKIATHYRRSRYLMSPEEFLKKLEEIETATPDRAKTRVGLPQAGSSG